MLHALCHSLQQQIADVAAEAVVHVAQTIDVECHDDGPHGRADAVADELVEPLAEHRALRKAGERVEIREQLEGVFLLPELQSEGDVRGHFLQQPQFLFAHLLALSRAQRQHADARAVDDERQRDHRTIALL